MIVCSDDYNKGITWEVETYAGTHSFVDMFEKYKTFDSWEEHTRTCEYCGKNFDAGYICGSGEGYACEECFECCGPDGCCGCTEVEATSTEEE